MRFYADVMQRGDLHELLATIEAQHGVATSLDVRRCSLDQRSRAIDALREALIEAGMLEQALADLPGAARLVYAAQALTDRCATALWSTYRRAAPSGRLAVPRILRGPSAELHVTLPEGFLFYALFPELYALLGHELTHSVAAGVPVVVIGVRSIGATLSAAVAAGLRAGGRATRRYTVRPAGDPFAREVEPSTATARRWHAASGRGALFVAVDEGPGLSGSSLAAVVTALERLGVEADRIRVLCAAPPRHLPMASPQVVETWRRIRWRAASDVEGSFWREALPELLGDALSRTLHVERDLSWGNWAALEAADGSGMLTLPHLERRKLLLAPGMPHTREPHAPGTPLDDLARAGGAIFARFIGFGATGRQKADLNRQLAQAGYAPPYLGHAHGMLLQAWCGPDRQTAPAHPARPPVAVAARYYAHLRQQYPVDVPEETVREQIGDLAGTVDQIARAWFGDDAPSGTFPIRAELRAVRPMRGDQRPEPVEWIVRHGSVLKCDAGDHFLDHSWARSQDVAFDLAGFILEFALTHPDQQELLDSYVRQSGDIHAATRLPFYRAVYAAHRLAGLDTAFHAAGDEQRPRIDAERRRMATALDAALRGRGVVPCAS